MSLDNLPVEWLLTSIENISEVIAGGTPKANDPENFVEPPNGIGWLTPADLSGYSHKYIGHGKRDLSEKGYKSSSAKLIPKGSVVFSSRAPIGYVAIASNEISTNQGFKNFVIDENISSEYLYYYLKRIRDLAESLGTGTTFKELSGSACKKLLFVLAPLAEQQEIVRQLDVMLAQVEQIKARLDAILPILKKFRQSVLADAVSGKLTEEWRAKNNSFTTNQVALEKEHHDTWVAHKEQYSLKGKYKKPHIVNEEHCFEIPQSWLWSNLGQLCWSVKDGPHFSPKYSDTGIPFISGGNIRPNKIDFSNCKYISEELNEELSKRCKPEFGDLLYTKGGTTGIAHLNQENKNFNVWVHVAVLKIINLVNGKYLQHALNSPHCYEQSQLYTHGVGNQDLGLTRLINITVPLPPQEEQLEIVRSIEHHHRLAEHIESLLESAKKRVNLLTQSILAKAFSGELTAEWREQHQDLITGVNSAEALLAKIQAEREASKPVKKAKKVK